MNAVLLVVATVVVMEPVAAAVHRFVGHGPGWALHRDHHDPGPGRLERNDAIPATFAVIAMVAFWVGLDRPGWRWLFWVALGVTLYGLAYALVHDVYVHRRLPLLPRRVTWLEPWRRAHLEHHRHGGAPFGVLVPLRPRRAGHRSPVT
jgi:beta-carotene 3-hydroxylase